MSFTYQYVVNVGVNMLEKVPPPSKSDTATINRKLEKWWGGMGHHYGGSGCGYQNVSIQIIEQVELGDDKALEKQEIYWQNQLRVYIQNGSNGHCRRKEKVH